jgi:hypothetical protein
MTQCWRRDLVGKNPAQFAELPSPSSRERILSDDEIRTLIEKRLLPPMDGFRSRLGTASGARNIGTNCHAFPRRSATHPQKAHQRSEDIEAMACANERD